MDKIIKNLKIILINYNLKDGGGKLWHVIIMKIHVLAVCTLVTVRDVILVKDVMLAKDVMRVVR